ncbi:Serine hydrolase-like protein 2 [Polyrhizophydium stewartii]|uniref:Serine hydrolase-like protein 2 n=1 Tax=Polyrhizophydium stewartii TaxID=2732419 RepID=A0ABR4N8H5_9FUNG|nr:hypothetical protein HK105_008252 [Polyrhizophydium stewartii]
MDFEFNGDELEFRTPAGLRIAGRHWGFSDGFPLLALHGWLDNCATWEELIPLWLGKHGVRFNMVAIDFAGHGRSEHRHPQAAYSMLLDIEDSISVVDALGWQRFGILGHSMGGMIGMYMAGMYPSRVEHLVVIEAIAPLYVPDYGALRSYVTTFREQKAYFSRKNPEKSKRVFKSLEDAAQIRAKAGYAISVPGARHLVARGTRPVSEGSTDLVWSSDQRLSIPNMFPVLKGFMVEVLQNVEAQVLLIMADHDYTPTFGSKTVRNILGSKLESHFMKDIPSHHLHLEPEYADKVGSIIFNFWSRQPSVAQRKNSSAEEVFRAKL